MDKLPLISIIMGTYNCVNTLPDAIDSIIRQGYDSWELIICDDGSTDNTYQIAEDYKSVLGNRLILVKNDKNYGLNYTLNKCLEECNGEYIARMDGDDTCNPDRLEIELNTLLDEPDIAFVSSDMQWFDESGVLGYIRHPEYPTAKDFIKGSPFGHAPSMIRRTAYEKVGGYTVDKRLLRVEDYHLWIKLYGKGMRGKNIHKPLYNVRLSESRASEKRKMRYRFNEAFVRIIAVKELKLPAINYIFALRPIIIGLLPTPIYKLLHRRSIGQKK